MSAPDWYTALSDTPPSRAATDPIPFHPLQTNQFSPGIGNQPPHDVLLREDLGIPAMANRAIANRIGSLVPLVKTERRIEAGTTVDEVIDDSPLKALLDRPHPNFSRSQLLRLTAQYIVSVGEAYWLKVGSRMGVPVELHPMLPEKVVPLVTNGVVEAYSVTDGDGQVQRLGAEFVVRFFFPDPEFPWQSEGYLGPVGVTADALKFIGQHLRKYYENDAMPKAWLEAGDQATPFRPEDRERFLCRLEEALRLTRWRLRRPPGHHAHGI